MTSIPSNSFPEVMARHNTQTFEHFLNLHFIQVQLINMSFSYIRLQMICLVILSSIIFRKEKVIIIAGVSFTDKQEERASLSQEQSMISMRKNKACTSMPKHISRKKETMREDNEIFSFSFGRVSRSDSVPPSGKLILSLKTTVF